jgi:lipid-A-disaccharide synthase
MLEAAKKLKEAFTNLKVLVSLASSVNRNVVEQIMEPYQGALDVKLVEGGAAQTFKRSTILVAVSGTVTLEAALSGIPMVIIYRVSPLSYRLGKAMIRVKFISLVNLIARRQILPELIQQEASPGKIAATVEKMLNDPNQLIRIHQQLFRIRNAFGQHGASGRVADIALDMINK